MLDSELDKTLRGYFPFGFQVSQKAWEWFGVGSLTEDLSAAQRAVDLYAVRRLADRINERRLHGSYVTEPVHAGHLVTMGIITDIFRYLIQIYCHDEFPGVLGRSDSWTVERLGPALLEQPPPAFVRLFPPRDVLRGAHSPTEYIEGQSEDVPHREIIAEEMILLYLAMQNPALKRFRDLFDDADMQQQSPYVPYVMGLQEFFAGQPPFGPLGMPLFDCLLAVIRACPDSLEDQLDYIRLHWGRFLPASLMEQLYLAADILREEQTLRGLGPGELRVLEFGRGTYGLDASYPEPAAFSQDADWMSNVVLMAKTVYVWLDQLSKRYQRDIRLLSDVPDEELDRLARWGFSGLWLIGLWERSSASQKIKQWTGNPEAAPSAYSLYDYVIAGDLGGESAYLNLRERAWQRGIRLASDMVPNHMGIYSRWMVEHPHWFLQAPYPPFPAYQFTGGNLSDDSRIGIYIEDGYWEQRDAAVVFKRVDFASGEECYIYHGNDGTSMPWNDTAQLNFLLAEVREAVVQTILHVARMFPIIRFDAAMTLAKKHYQRLWFPLHGEGGAIPSRAEHGLSKPEFDAVFPKEFWREVVDRVKAEVPETLLLAEAFWLMEGYFVRTLGMHRVYNSAFMNMLKMEENSKYRLTVKNVLEFSPEVLKRFVNFMNNPDEKTAVEQFGKDDKYYGVALMMVTMPGLPMFGHGQIEGFTEKYGMEYRKAYWDEQVDEDMVRRHEREIFPLMRRRRLFSGAENFAFYDFTTPEGWVDENVFAYSNRADSERAIILYNNAYSTTRGHIHTSTAINVGSGDDTVLERRSLGQALALDTADGCYYAYRDHKSGLEYIRTGRSLAEEGVHVELHAYQYHALLEWRELRDQDGLWGEVHHRLGGAGVPSLDETRRAVQLDPILAPFTQLMEPENLRRLGSAKPDARERFHETLYHWLEAAATFVGMPSGCEKIYQDVVTDLAAVCDGPAGLAPGQLERKTMQHLTALRKSEPDGWLNELLSVWAIARHVGQLHAPLEKATAETLARARFSDWLLGQKIQDSFSVLRESGEVGYEDTLLVSILIGLDNPLLPGVSASVAAGMTRFCDDDRVRRFLRVNQHEGSWWLSKEQIERMLQVLVVSAIAQMQTADELDEKHAAAVLDARRRILSAAEGAGYDLMITLDLLAAH